MNVVIIEDEGLSALFLQEIIKDLNHNVVGVFDNSNTLFPFLTNHQVDLILMDINIKGPLDGIQTANIAHSQYPDILFVYLTSYKDSETIKSAQEVKPLGYLIKPVLESDLEAIMMVVDGYKKCCGSVTPTEIRLEEYSYDIKSKVLYRDDEAISLSKNEKVCIDTFVSNIDAYISSEQLIAIIWGDEENRVVSLRELVYRLRKKLPNLPLKSTPNVGYILSSSKKI